MALQIFYFKEAMKLFALFGVFLITEVTCETAVEYRDLILQKHNDYRRQQGGSNINKLVSYCSQGLFHTLYHLAARILFNV